MIRNLILKSTKSQNLSRFYKPQTTNFNNITITSNNKKCILFNDTNNGNNIYYLNNGMQYSTTSNNNSSNNNNNNNSTNSTKTLIKKVESLNKESSPSSANEKSIYGSIGDIDFSKKESGPSKNALSREKLSKSLLLMRKSGTLSSVNMMAKMENENSTPVYGSLAAYALFDSEEEVSGDITQEHLKTKVTVYNPIIALHKSSQHIKHFKHFSKVSLVVYPLTPLGRSPSEYDLPRVNFSGRMKLLPSPNVSKDPQDILAYTKAKRLYFERHPNSKSIMGGDQCDKDYEFFIMDISDVYYYERNQKLTSIPIDVFKCSSADPVTIQSREIIETVNSKYQDSLSLIVEQYGDVKLDDCFMYFVDCFGLNCIGKKKGIDEWLDIRIPFDSSFDNFENCKSGLYETLRLVRNKIF
ncbi:hypothetical protein ACTFIU_010946 [Dictyostelium citrinum]